MRDLLKRAAFGAATVAVVPFLLSFLLRASVVGRDRAIEGSTQALGLVPGLAGQYLRRAFLARTLASFHWTATVEFGTLFSSAGARLDENVYVGPRCHLGLVHLERDVLVGAGRARHQRLGRHTAPRRWRGPFASRSGPRPW